MTPYPDAPDYDRAECEIADGTRQPRKPWREPELDEYPEDDQLSEPITPKTQTKC